jgi:hypothetical protein
MSASPRVIERQDGPGDPFAMAQRIVVRSVLFEGVECPTASGSGASRYWGANACYSWQPRSNIIFSSSAHPATSASALVANRWGECHRGRPTGNGRRE